MATKCPKCQTNNPETVKFCGECGTQLIPTEAHYASKTLTLETQAERLTRGTVFAGRYEILEGLGTGGMGAVYRVYDRKLEEEVALKLIRPEIAASRKAIDRFKNELRVARKITHKSVCKMYDLGESGGTSYITMEYVTGEDLKSAIHRMGTITIGKAVSIAAQVAEGLSEAHKLGIIHRDLKPGNIMIDKEGNAKIMDFGIARSLAAAGTTAEGAIIGTPEYMSPEQVEGKPADQRADVYALGVILFEMVTGRPPFEGETSLAVAHKHRYEPAPDPCALNPQIPEDLGRLILRCVEKEKEKRCQSASEVQAELEKIEQQIPSTERVTPARKPFTSKEITVKFIPKKLLIPALALVFIAAIAWIFFMKDPGRRKTLSASSKNSIAVLPFTDLSPEKDQAAWCEGIAETLLNSLAGMKSLDVRGRHSSFLFTAQDDPREAGKKLNAEKLLTGSLQRFGDRLRITVQLVDSATGTPDWAEKFDGEMGEIFDIQDRIASAAITKMNVELRPEEKARLEKRYTNNQEAYDLYLKGNYAVNRGTTDDMLRAISFYLEAAQKDPDFVLAHIALARCYKDLAVGYAIWPKEKGYKQSREALTRAFALDNVNGEAFAVRAALKFHFENNPAGAELDYQRAFQLSPRNSIILKDRLWYLTAKGMLEEALSEAKLLIEIDPLDPYGYWSSGLVYYCLRRYDDSISAYQEALELNPDFEPAQGWSIFTYLAQGQYEKARDMAKRFEHQDPDQFLFSMVVIEGSRGNKEEAEKYKKALDDFFKEKYSQPIPSNWEAAYYAVMGDRDKTLVNLTKLLSEDRHGGLGNFFLYWHYFDKFRSDPGFIALFKRAGFEMK